MNKLAEQTREQIRELTLRGYSDTQIAKKLNLDRSIVWYHYDKVKKSIEFTNRRDLIDSFDSEYAMVRASFEFRKARLEERLEKAEKEDLPLSDITNLERLIHQLDVDRWRLLGDNEVVLAVRRLKDERRVSRETPPRVN